MNPSRLVEAAFQRIYIEHMSDVPIINPALRVQAIDFTLWRDNWLGVLITPWCINLLLLPGPNGQWKSVSGNERLFRQFPSGDYAFLGGHEAEIGEYQSCSLISTMAQFSGPESACEVAREVIRHLLEAPAPKMPERKYGGPDAPSPSKRRFLLLGNAT